MYKHERIYGETTIDNTDAEGDHTIRLKYYKTKQKKYGKHEKKYGVGVIKTVVESNQINEEKQEFNKICAQKSEVENLLNVLLRNKVTPISLKYILEDMVL